MRSSRWAAIAAAACLVAPAAALFAQAPDADQLARKEARAALCEARAMAGASGDAAGPRQVVRAAARLSRALEKDGEEQAEEALEELDGSLAAVEKDPAVLGPDPVAKQHMLNVRWKVRRLSEILETEGGERTFTVGQVTPEQASVLHVKLDQLLARAGTFKGLLTEADPELMYRNLLIMQMDSFAEPVARIRQALSTDPPWWTPEAYQAAVQVTRLVALTRNETRKLTPELMSALEGVWSAADAVLDAVNRIEGGARDSGPDARIVYRPRPETR